MAFWTRLRRVFEEPDHPWSYARPHPLQHLLLWCEPKQDTCVCFPSFNLKVFLLSFLQASAGKVCVSACVCVWVCMRVFSQRSRCLEQSVAHQRNNERAGTIATGSWATTQSDSGTTTCCLCFFCLCCCCCFCVCAYITRAPLCVHCMQRHCDVCNFCQTVTWINISRSVWLLFDHLCDWRWITAGLNTLMSRLLRGGWIR